MRRKTGLRAAVAAGLLACLMGSAPARASNGSDAAWGVGSALASLVYAPLKLGYATVGMLFGGIGWSVSGGSAEVADTVIGPAVRGDYVVTPAHLRGERRLQFVGMAASREPEGSVVDWGPPEDPYDDAYYGY